MSTIALLRILGVTTKVQKYVQVQAENRLMVRLCDAAAQFPLLESIQGGNVRYAQSQKIEKNILE